MRAGQVTKLNINGKDREISAAADTPLLWVLRDEMGLTGTKFGCGIAQCGACTVHADGEAIRSCVTTVEMAQGMRITTIEGLEAKHPLQAAWERHNVPQCGYCQSGQIMSAAALLAAKPKPNDAEIVEAMNGNICRCGCYNRIVAAIKDAAGVAA
jgi:isoquinoline 1-oxidoreductase alpha subunit